jgi:hypothetical protein
MYGLKGWMVPIIVLIVLIAVIGVGIFQINSKENPWDFGGSDFKVWSFLEK